MKLIKIKISKIKIQKGEKLDSMPPSFSFLFIIHKNNISHTEISKNIKIHEFR